MITRMSLVSIRYLLLFTITIVAATSIVYADPITINSSSGGILQPSSHLNIVITAGGPTTFTFQNGSFFPLPPRATDFHVSIVNGVIGAGSGGDPFPVTVIPENCQVEGGGATCMDFLAGPIGGGIAPGGTYTFSFIGFPDQTQFQVAFSARVGDEVVFFPPTPVGTPPIPPTTGSVTSVPEPSTMLLLGTGVAGVVCEMRKRLKNQARRH